MPSCASSLPCAAQYGGPLGPSLGGTPPDDTESAIVGLEIYYADPEAPPPPSPATSGNVYGIASVTLARAQDILSGNPRPATHSFVPDLWSPPAGAAIGSFAAGPGSTIYGFNVWYGADGAQQIQAVYRPLSSGAEAQTAILSPKYPSALAPDSSATEYQLGCLGGNQYPYSLVWNTTDTPQGHTGSLGKIELMCNDFSLAFSNSGARAAQCCTGQQSQFCWGNVPQNSQCDAYFQDYCRPLCGSDGSCADAVCGCVASPVAAPQCIDARCAGVPGAYRPQGTLPADGCPAAITCDQYAALGNGAQLARGISVPAACRPPAAGNPLLEWMKKNALLVVAIFFFLLIVVLAILTGGDPAAATKHLAGGLPPLPPLQAFN